MNSLRNLDWEEVLAKVSGYATSEVGRARLTATSPMSSPAAARNVCQQIREAQLVINSGRRCFMQSLDLFGLWHQRLTKGAVLKPLELKDVRHFCLETIALKEVLKPYPTPWLKASEQRLLEASEPLSAIDQIMTIEGDIRTDASETLFKLYRERSQQVKAVQSILDRLVKQHEMEPLLQERYVTNREGRWVLPVKSGMQHHFDGIIHGTSQTKQTVFMEPKEIIPLNNRLRQIEVDIEEEVERLLTELSKYLATRAGEFEQARDVLLEFDVRFAEAQLATHLGAEPATFSDDEIRLNQLRHPVLVLNGVEVVANTVHLDSERRLLLLSGPNAGGKTVLLKAVGLAAQMARCGWPICAQEGSRLPFFTDIHVAVGDAQSVDAQLSTFAAHLRILNEATLVKGPQHLLLIDEICGSTDPEEGSALARAFLEAYAAAGVFGVITSHLSPLKLGWQPSSGVINGSLEYDQGTGRPTYQFLMGVPGQSLAIQTARRVGVDGKVIDKALSHLSPTLKSYQLELSEVETMKTELRRLKAKMDQEAKALEIERAKYQALTQKFNEERDRMLETAVQRAEKKIDQLIEHAKVGEVFRRHERLEQAKFELPKIIKMSGTTGQPPRIQTAEDFSRAFPPGSKVFVPSLGRDAVVQGQPNNRGEVPILANSMRLTVAWQQLKAPQAGGNPTLDIVRKTKDIVTSPFEGDRSIDVRGLSLEEAIQQIESQLDTATLHQEDRLKIIHGHGTETLKRGIRNFLSRSVYVKKWQVGGTDTGGDAVTWVELKD